jgi:hypothetical protein
MRDPQLQISHSEFSHALSNLALALPRKGREMDVRIDFDGELVRMTTAGVEVSLDGKGRWSGFVLAPLRPLVQMRSNLPDADPLAIRYSGGRFYVQGWSVSASWHDVGSEPASIPLNPTILHLLQFKASMTEAKLVSSSLRSAVSTAEGRAQKLMLRAQDILRPLGITLRDLEELLDRKIKTPNK